LHQARHPVSTPSVLAFHILPQQFIDSGLISLPLRLEPNQYIFINAQSHWLFCRHAEFGLLEEIIIQLGNIAGIDSFISP
jgi:hypothetical protein